MDRTSYSAYTLSTICHIGLLAWFLWGVQRIDTALDRTSIIAVPEAVSSDLNSDSHQKKAQASSSPADTLVVMPERSTEAHGQFTLPPLPEIKNRELSSDFITPQLFHTSGTDRLHNEGDTQPYTTAIRLPHSRYQDQYQNDGGVMPQHTEHHADIEEGIKSVSEYWYTIHIFLGNQYRRVWKQRFHKKLPSHTMLLSIRIHNSILASADIRRGTGNQDFDDAFIIWLHNCIDRKELHGPPVADGSYPVEFLIR